MISMDPDAESVKTSLNQLSLGIQKQPNDI
jgi:hypothetical protein